MRRFGFIDEDRLFRGGGELGRARSDPAIRARIDELKRREREGVRRWLAELENRYRKFDEADPVTPERVMGSKGDAAFGRDLILKVIRLAEQRLDSGDALTWWSKEIRDLERLHAQVSIALGVATCDGLKTRESRRSMRKKARIVQAAKRQRTERDIRNLFERVTAANPRWSYTRRCEEVGKRWQQGMSGRNVRRYIGNPTPRKKK